MSKPELALGCRIVSIPLVTRRLPGFANEDRFYIGTSRRLTEAEGGDSEYVEL